MLAEALVIFACVNGSGCAQSSSLYFSENPDIKESLDKYAQEASQLISPKIVNAVAPAVFIVSGGGTVKLSNDFSANLNKSGGSLIFHVDF